jgi:hypothetical protein
MTLLMLVAAMKLNSSYAVCGRSRVHTCSEASGAGSQEVRQKCGFFGEGFTWVAVRRLTNDVIRSFQRNGYANLASAIAFRVVLSLVPFLLFLLALIANAFLAGIQLDANVRDPA